MMIYTPDPKFEITPEPPPIVEVAEPEMPDVVIVWQGEEVNDES